MRFAYYERLSAAERRVYRRSDSLSEVSLPPGLPLDRATNAVAAALATGVRAKVERASQGLANVVTRGLRVPGVRVHILDVRPKNNDGELYGLYTREEDGRSQIELWMRTAEQRRVVALRTYLRTLAHELCHHLDFVLFELPDTYHTQGFFRRESSVYDSLCAALAPARKGERSTPKPMRAKERESVAPQARRRQLTLFE